MPRPAKNIVVCCDGTGNKYDYTNSNVVKLYTCLDVREEQAAYYHPGVGTMGDPRQTTWIGEKISMVKGLAVGAGFIENVGDAYKFLMNEYADGDRIYLFGFSRGAYTVRALAGALFMYGLLCPGNEGHLAYLLDMFSDESRDAYTRKYDKGKAKKLGETPISRGFRDTFSRVVPIHFIGIWDTVSSVGLYDPVKLLFDGQNPVVRRVRHAVSVDERRCFFQANLLGKPLPESETPVLTKCYKSAADPTAHLQNILQAWFAGVHSDVGGSYDQSECAPAMDALRWMLEEATAEKDPATGKSVLLINEGKRDAIFGRSSTGYPDLEAMNKAPKPMWKLHNSLTWRDPKTWGWIPLEAFPHKYFDEFGTKRWRLTPWPHSREIPDGSLLHPSLRHRLDTDAAYQPKNLDRAKVWDYGRSPVALPQPGLMQQLKDQDYGVYRPGSRRPANPVAAAASIAAVLILGIAGWILRR
jgi:uncharacterized protein (DUF2235 family)